MRKVRSGLTVSIVCGDTSNGGSHQTDWRLPNQFELESLLNLENGSGRPDGNPFNGTLVNSRYWTSTTNATSPEGAWVVIFGNSNVSARVKSQPNLVLAVRGGPPAGDLDDDGDVDRDDLNIVVGCFGQTAPLAPPCDAADVAPPPDGDGVINILDISFVGSNFTP